VNIWTVVDQVIDLISIQINVAEVTEAVTIFVVLKRVVDGDTVVTHIAKSIAILIELVDVSYARTVILRVFNPIIIKVISMLIGVSEVSESDQN
jgi:hypothetical protein